MNFKRSSQSGNALWFVLLAVALLGFLTAVVSRTSSSVEQTGSVEQARIKAAALLRYTQSIEAAIQQMMMNNGISESDLDFVAIDATTHDNTKCTTKACEVFDVVGGGISYRLASDVLGLKNATDNWIVTSGNRLYQFGCDDATTDCTELLLLLPNIPKMVCLQINKLQDIKNPSEDAPQQGTILLTPAFTGTYTGTNSNFIGGTITANESTEVQGKPSGCVYDKSAKQYTFYQLLVAR